MDDKGSVFSSGQCQKFASIVSIITIVVGLAVLVGWVYNITFLKSLRPEWISMKPNTAVSFIFCGIVLWQLRKEKMSLPARVIARIFASLIMLIAILTLAEYFLGRSLGIDQLLFQDTSMKTHELYPGRIAFVMACNFLLLGVSFYLVSTNFSKSSIFQISPIIVIMSTWVAFLCYVYKADVHYHPPYYFWAAAHAMLLFFLLSIALIALRPLRGVCKIILKKSISGELFRRTIPLAFLVPLAAGLLEKWADRLDVVDPAFSDVTLLSLITLGAIIVIFYNSKNLYKQEKKTWVALNEIQKAEYVFHEFSDNVNEVFWRTTPTLNKVIYVSKAYETIWGRKCQDLYNNPADWSEAIVAEDRQRVEHLFFKKLTTTEDSVSAEYQIMRPDGSLRHILDRGFQLKDDQGTVIGLLGIAADITQDKETRYSLTIQRDMLRILEQGRNIKDIAGKILKLLCIVLEWDYAEIWLVDFENNILRNLELWHRPELDCPHFDKISHDLTIAMGQLVPGKAWQDAKEVWISEISQHENIIRGESAMHAGFNSTLALPIVFQDNVIGVMSFFSHNIRKPNEVMTLVLQHVCGQIGETVHQKYTQEQIEHSTHHDPITDLLNQNVFQLKINEKIKLGSASFSGLFIFEIDRFSFIISTIGYEAGDLLLKMIAVRLQKIMDYQNEFAARFEVNQFALFMQQAINIDNIIGYAHKILSLFSEPFFINGEDIFINTNIGIALFPADGQDSAMLLRQANVALAEAKKEGKNNFELSNAELPLLLSDRLSLEMALRHALTKSEFTLVYQPQVDLKTGAIIGVEALIRWQHPSKGLLKPIHFIPLAEETDLIIPITEWVIREVCQQIKNEWPNSKVPISINIPAHHFFKQHDLLSLMQAMTHEYGINPNLIGLEITESVMINQTQYCFDTLAALNKLGFSMSFDDFGTGFSSLAYLRTIPANTIKIDKSFIDGLPLNSDNVAIVRSIIALSHALGKMVIAEGVEYVEQLKFLIQEGCDALQGYYFSQPVPIEEVKVMIANDTRLKIPPV